MRNIFKRSKLNPILRPENTEWWKIYNPGAAIDENGRIHIFPRVVKKELDWHSRIAHAYSDDGENFIWDKQLALIRIGEGELRGLEDPRITKIDDTYHMVFAAYDGRKVLLHSAISKSLDGPWLRHGPMMPNFDFFKNGGRMVKWEGGKPLEKMTTKRGNIWNKSGALFPKKINGEYVMIFGEYFMWLATSTDGINFTEDPKPILEPRKGTKFFDNTFIEMGPSPILTEKGWLVLYHGIDEAFRYQIGFVVLDINDPRKIIYRSDEPIFGPQEKYEIGDALIDVISGGITAMSKMDDNELKEFYKKARNENIMPQVTFCPGAIVDGDTIRIYYGAGDTSICTATASIYEILSIM